MTVLLEVIFNSLHKSARFDLGVVEIARRAASHRIGAKAWNGC